jgi:hypothetical protein
MPPHQPTNGRDNHAPDGKPNGGAKTYKSVIYGDFLLSKVTNNFAVGDDQKKGRY